MAKLWVVYREGLRLLGNVVTEVSLEKSVSKLDIAPWRFFSATSPENVPPERLRSAPGRKRVLLEVREEDRGDFCGFAIGLFDSPYPPKECFRRLSLPEAP